MDHSLTQGGQFTINDTPSGTIDCLQGNLCWALLEMGYEDPRLEEAFEWMARTVTGEGMAPKTEKDAERRYYAYNCGPLFACGGNYNQPCAWGATKVMLALGKVPKSKRTQLINNAIQQGMDFLLAPILQRGIGLTVGRINQAQIGGNLVSQSSMSPTFYRWWRLWWIGVCQRSTPGKCDRAHPGKAG